MATTHAPIEAGTLEAFLTLSATLTGYSPFRLRGTGQAETHLTAVTGAVGQTVVDDLLACSARAHDEAGGDEAALHRGVRADLLSDDRLGPVARGIIKLWFVGIWYALPKGWQDAYGTGAPQPTFVPTPSSYTEALLWPTIGANPPGAKAPGYGTWADPPRIPTA